MAIDAGKMRHRLEHFQISSGARDDSGKKTVVLSSLGFFWAEVLTAKQAMQRVGAGLDYTKKKVFHCRYKKDIAVGQQLKHQSELYEITDVENPADKNIELFIEAELKP